MTETDQNTSVSYKDFLLVLALEKDPLMSVKDLSKEISVSWPTVKKRYEDILKRGIIRTPRAIPEIEKLGLQRMTVIADFTEFTQMQRMEQACTIYPYTKYRARMIGEKIGLFMQFDIPANEQAITMFESFLDELKIRSLLSDYTVFSNQGIRKEVFPDFSKFNWETSTWEYSWDEWFDRLKTQKDYELPIPTPVNNDFSEYTPIAFDFLAALSEDGSLKQSDLMERFNLSRTETYRQYQYVRNNFVSSIRLNYNRDSFDLSETFVFLISEISIQDQAKLFHMMSNDPPPFRFAIEILENKNVIIWGSMSLNQSSSFVFQLWNIYPNLRMWRLSTNDNGAMQYYFYPPNFDFEKMEWKNSKYWMVDGPLKEI